jgi:hypothetical protein
MVDTMTADDAPLQDAVRLSLVAADTAAFRRALEDHKPEMAAAPATQLVFLMDWFHRWQQEYEAFAEVLEAELADADEEAGGDAEEADAEPDADGEAGDGRAIQFVEKDLEDLEAEAHEVFSGFSTVAIDLVDALGDSISSESLLDKHGWTLLMQAANSGLRELTDALIAKGVDVNSAGTEKEGATPLYLALSSDHTAEAMVLLKNGAIASATKVVRSSLETDADDDGEPEGEQHVEEDCAWFQACRLGQLDVIEEMIALGVDVNFALPTSGERALHVAVMFEMQDVVELLVANDKIEVNAKNTMGQTCLFGCSNVELVQFLVEKAGVDVSVKDDDEETAYSMAKELGDDAVAELLKSRTT